MTDRVHPSAKPTAAAPTTTIPTRTPAVSTQPLPTVKPPPSKVANLYNPNLRRPVAASRRHPKHRSTFTFRRCCCLTCCWLFLLLIAVILLGFIALAAVNVLYRPMKPAFTVTSLKFLQYSLTVTHPDEATHLAAKMNLTLSVKNPNGKIGFTYDPLTLSVSSRSIDIANVTYPEFENGPGNTKVIHTVIGPNAQIIEGGDLNDMNMDLRKRNAVPIEIVVDTMIGVKMDKWKFKKVGIRVKCGGIQGALPKVKGKVVIPSVANTVKAKCKVDLRIKIWKFTF